MNVRDGVRVVSASDVFDRIGNYTILLGCIALTIVVMFGLPKIGARQLDPFVHTDTTLKRFFANPSAAFPMRSFTAPQPPAQPIFEKELTMTSGELLNRWDPFVAEASRRFGISEAWIRAVMRIESGGRTVQAGDQPITSNAGAMGLMQLMQGTYAEMRAQYGLGSNPFNPHDNVIAGAGYLRWLYRKYGFPNMFAAYNDGPGKLEDHLQNGSPLPVETRNYIASITRILSVPERLRHHSLIELASNTPRRGHRFTVTLGG